MSFLNWFRKTNEPNRLTLPSIHYQVSQVPFQKGSKLSSQSITVKLLHQFSDKPADLTITSTHIIGLNQLKIDLSKVTLTDPTINECVQSYPWKIVVTDEDFWYCFYFKSELVVREFSEEVHKQILRIGENKDKLVKKGKERESKHGCKRILESEVIAKEPIQVLKMSKMSSTMNDSLMTESSPLKMPMFSPVKNARDLASESKKSPKLSPKSSPSKSESLQLSPTPKLSPSKSSLSNFSPSKFSPSKLNFLQFSPQKSNLSLCFQLVNKVYNLESVIKTNNRELNDQMHKVRTDVHKQVGNIENMIKQHLEHVENDGSSASRKSDTELKSNVTDLNGRMAGLENSVKFCTEMTLQTNEFFKNLESERRVEKQRENKIANEREDKLLGIISKLTDDTKHELIKNENVGKYQTTENTKNPENDDL